jgi:hypothetical protein
MTVDDREIIADIRSRLHGIVMYAGQLSDPELYRDLEVRIDKVLNWLKQVRPPNTLTTRGR